MNFVFVSLQRINTDRESTSTSLAKELSRNHKVLYVNPPIDRKTQFSKNNDKYISEHIRITRERGNFLNRISDNLWSLDTASVLESINWIPFTPLFSLINRVNNGRFARDIKESLAALGFDDFIIVNDKDMFRSFYLKELLKPKLYIYLDRDFTLGIDYWKRHGLKIEPELIKKADAVVCNSYDFTKNAKHYNKHSFYIGNGCDLNLFDSSVTWKIPEKLQSIPRPIIGYVGVLNTLRLDLKLLIQMTSKKKEWSFVLVGPEDDDFSKSELHSMKNVHFLGKIHTALMPQYMSHFDVCLNPQIVNEITIGNFPLKIVEYLAMGRPVIATETNTMNEIFSGFTSIVTGPEGFIDAIEKSLNEDEKTVKDAERVKFAQNFSWAKIADNLLNVIDTVSKT